MNFKTIIEDINRRNKNTVFNFTPLQEAERFLVSYDVNAQYLDHGGDVLCFRSSSSNNRVYKLIVKSNDSLVTTSYTNLLARYRFLQLHYIHMKFIHPGMLIFDNQHCFIVEQDACSPCNPSNFTFHSAATIFDFVLQTIIRKKILPDVRPSNFGYFENTLYLFDYHDNLVHHPSKSGLLVITLKQCVDCLFKNASLKGVFDAESELIKTFNSKFQLFVATASDESKETFEIIKILTEIVFILRQLHCAKYDNYQKATVNGQNMLIPIAHTAEKLNVVVEVVEYLLQSNMLTKSFSMLDAGCSLGVIGNSVGQRYPQSSVTLNNITQTELETAKSLAKHCNLSNVSFDGQNIYDLKTSFDVTAYFAVWHHLLKRYTVDEAVQKIANQTKKCTIIELPFFGDCLLDKVIGEDATLWENRYSCLKELNNFLTKLEQHFDTLTVHKVDYSNEQIVRYAIVAIKNHHAHMT